MNLKPIGSEDHSVAIFLHWSKNDEISPADFAYIKHLSGEFNQVLVIKNVNSFEKTKNVKLDHIANVEILSRQNIGYDFGGYRAGILEIRHQTKPITELVICNNSVYLASNTLSQTIKTARCMELDLVAATNSFEIQPHLQSYFLRFGPKILRSDFFWNFWENLPTYEDKQETVNNLEVTLATSFEDIGFTAGAIWDFERMVSCISSDIGRMITFESRHEPGNRHLFNCISLGIPFNVTHYAWQYLLEADYPFIKKDLLRDFSDMGLNLSRWADYCTQEAAQYINNELGSSRLKIKGVSLQNS